MVILKGEEEGGKNYFFGGGLGKRDDLAWHRVGLNGKGYRELKEKLADSKR